MKDLKNIPFSVHIYPIIVLYIRISVPTVLRARVAVNYKKGCPLSQAQVIKFTSCLPMVGGSLQVLRLLPPLKLVAILLKVALQH